MLCLFWDCAAQDSFLMSLCFLCPAHFHCSLSRYRLACSFTLILTKKSATHECFLFLRRCYGLFPLLQMTSIVVVIGKTGRTATIAISARKKIACPGNRIWVHGATPPHRQTALLYGFKREYESQVPSALQGRSCCNVAIEFVILN